MGSIIYILISGTAYRACFYFVWMLLDRATIRIHILRIVVMMETLFVL
jgi:hypothetical protein